MYQSFESRTDPLLAAPRVAALRLQLQAAGLDGFIVPHTDNHQSEYLPANAERLLWLTGFSGSAGSAIVTAGGAAIFVDGRYTIQVRDEVDTEIFDIRHLVNKPLTEWIETHATDGGRIGYDPWLHTPKDVEKLAKACRNARMTLVPVDENPVDAVWTERPAPPLGAASDHPERLAGESRADKIERISADLPADAAIITAGESIAWLFNLRGSDIVHNPVVLADAIVRRGGRPTLFIHGQKLSSSLRDALSETAHLKAPDEFEEALAGLEGSVAIDAAATPEKIVRILTTSGAEIIEAPDPVQLPRARKNTVEIAGARAAHLRDAVPVCRFLAWLDRDAGSGDVDEIAAAKRLETFRTETGALEEISFDTISGAGPNGAIVHYRVTQATSRPLEPDTLYLVDSGAQYRDGTTDITRTIAIGRPSDDMARHFTLVLKGHIAIATARFPVGTTGAQLDTLARVALWRAGLDYDHGTGHGVGSYLGVHEGPQRIAKTGSTALQPGMILSNEPGYYKAGAYGIRIENLLVVHEAGEIEGGDRPMLGFETLTLVPIDRRLIRTDLLGAEERAWVDDYHARVFAAVSPELEGDDHVWLENATLPLCA